jgi:hypothetical protein
MDLALCIRGDAKFVIAVTAVSVCSSLDVLFCQIPVSFSVPLRKDFDNINDYVHEGVTSLTTNSSISHSPWSSAISRPWSQFRRE